MCKYVEDVKIRIVVQWKLFSSFSGKELRKLALKPLACLTSISVLPDLCLTTLAGDSNGPSRSRGGGVPFRPPGVEARVLKSCEVDRSGVVSSGKVLFLYFISISRALLRRAVEVMDD